MELPIKFPLPLLPSHLLQVSYEEFGDFGDDFEESERGGPGLFDDIKEEIASVSQGGGREL